MDWTQTLAIIATLIGAVFTFYRLTRDEISVIREDMKAMDARWEERFSKIDARWEERWTRSEEKWERLFERLLIQDQQKSKNA